MIIVRKVHNAEAGKIRARQHCEENKLKYQKKWKREREKWANDKEYQVKQGKRRVHFAKFQRKAENERPQKERT